ncbi:unnamed protein product [Clavelina lepadiformis]|uniref:LRRCT domain-containing protein n=1 Tax=Clavelina lepadiformis TaxID=159417 RepID=A0ABP0EX90_CLALP
MAVRWTASVRYQLLTGMLSTLLICSTKRMDATNVTNNKGYDATVSTRTFCGWSVSVFSIVSAFPKHCGSSRTIYGYEVTCEKDMKSLPTTLPCPTVSLTYTNSWIKGDTLNKGDVAAFLNVTQLILDNNRIRFIARDVFEIMPYLKRLSLNHNPIAVKENIGVFSMLPQRLLELNLENITMKHEQTATFWLLFEDIPLFIAADEVSNLQNSSAFETQRPQITFAALNEIQLRNNRLDYIDMPVLKRAGLLKSLKRIDLSNNWLKHQALQNLLEAFIDDHKRKRASTTEPEKSVRYIEPTAVKLHIDLSSNRIRLINETTVKKFTKLLQIINQSATAKLNARTKERDQLQLSLSLKGNPFDCYCEIKPFVRFLFDDHGKTLLKNEQELTCSYPPLLKGKSLLNAVVLKIFISRILHGLVLCVYSIKHFMHQSKMTTRSRAVVLNRWSADPWGSAKRFQLVRENFEICNIKYEFLKIFCCLSLLFEIGLNICLIAYCDGTIQKLIEIYHPQGRPIVMH